MEYLFVSPEIANQLKEKGFTNPCLAYHTSVDGIRIHPNINTDYGINSYPTMYCAEINKDGTPTKGVMSAPLYQQVINWLLDKHEIDIDTHYNSNLTKKHQFQINTKGFFCKIDCETEFDTKKECLDAAIQEAIKLI